MKVGDFINQFARRREEREEFFPRGKPLERIKEQDLKRVKNEGRKWVLVLLVFTFVASLGFWIWGEVQGGQTGIISPVGEKIENSTNEKPATQRTQKETGGTENKIRELIKDSKGTYGVYVYNLTEKQGFGINQDEIFPAASLIKLPVILTLYQKAEKGEIELETKYVLKEADKRTGAGIIQYKPAGTVYTYRKLAELMGQQSDNTAFNVIRSLLGDEEIQKTIDNLGMNKTSLEKNETSAADIGLFFRKFYSQSLLTRNHRDEILDYLTKTAFEDRIPAGVPEDVKVAHKIGTETGSFSDAGIVFGQKPFILVILSKNALEKEALKTLPEITKIVWEFENQ